jgi:hypothetical protein
MKPLLSALLTFLVALLLAVRPIAQTTPDPNELARRVVNNELQAEDRDHSHWLFRLDTEKPGGAKDADKVVETRDGDLKWPLLRNGHEVDPNEAERDVQRLANNPSELRKSQKDKNEDSDNSQRMLKTLPEAFIYTFGQRRGDLVELKFSPDPRFKPPDHEAQVFHSMQGSLWVNEKQLRLAEIDGHMIHEVKFAGGLLGHLDRGGTFDVKQAEVAPGYWEMTVLNVHMRGKALFFKTISVQQSYARSDFKRVPDDLTARKGAELLNKPDAGQSARASLR